MKKPLLAALMGSLSLSLAFPASSSESGAVPVLDCDNGATGGDTYGSYGFYLPSYPGETIDGIDLWVTATAARTYDLRVEARLGAYDGPILGTANVSLDLTADPTGNQLAAFRWPSAAVQAGDTVAFLTYMDSALQPGENAYYAVKNNSTCPIVQTNDTAPPLGNTFRRQGVRAVIYGQATTAVDAASWGRIKSSYR